jgi:hypothetical protein
MLQSSRPAVPQPVVRVPLGVGGPVWGGGYAKIILVKAENAKKMGVKIKTQKKSNKVLVYKERLV